MRVGTPRASANWARLPAVLCFLLLPTAAQAYPWMIRHDYTGCAVCHVDPSGGGLLTDYGRAQNVLLMQMNYTDAVKSDEPAFAGFAFGAVPLPNWLLAQVTFRGAEFWLSQTTPAHDGQPSTTATQQMFIMMLLDARAELKLGIFRAGGAIGWGTTPFTLPIAIVTNAAGTQMLITREYWVGLQVDDTTLIRVGQMNLPFGLRIVEHTAWVRYSTQTDINYSQQTGAAVAFDNGHVRTEVMGIVGNLEVSPDAYRQRGFSGLVEVPIAERATIGMSALITRAELTLASPSPGLHEVYAVFSRFAPIEQVGVVVEGDVFFNNNLGSGVLQPNGATWLQVDYEPIQGIHIMPAVETLNTYGIHGTGFGTWLTLDWFCLPHTDIRLDGVYRSEPATTSPALQTFSFLVQLHTFL